MKLEGKALEDFEKFASSVYGESKKDLIWMRTLFLNALIIEWFDSVGINICITQVYPMDIYGYAFNIDMKSYHTYCKTRQEATEQAIIKANEIYNQKQE